MKLKPLTIGNLTASVPVIQGGMGIGISLSSLAGAVAKQGGIGVISAAQPGYNYEGWEENPLETNLKALGDHIRKAKEISDGGIIGVNIMRAGKNYAEYVKCCIQNKADIIISGAGLPMDLPVLTGDADIKYAPIVSSLKAAKVLLQRWHKKGLRMPDFVVIEGPKAGGHLGFTAEEAVNKTREEYDEEVKKIVEYVKGYEEIYGRPFPVVFAGGIFDRKDIDHYISLGCDGVQMATRFVATYECDAPEVYKQAYVNAKKDDVIIIKSPVGMPGRALKNSFSASDEKENITHCYACLEGCNPKETPYCITKALIRAADNKSPIDSSLVFCGENVHRIDRICSVKEIFDELNG